MRLLVVLRYYPFPPRKGSSIIAYNNIRELSKRHSIYFICVETPKVEGDLAEFVERIELVRLWSIPSVLKMIRSVFYMLFGIPRFASNCVSRKTQKRVRELMEKDKYDAILLYEMVLIR